MKTITLAALGAAMVVAVPAAAQTAVPQPAPAAVLSAVPDGNVLRTGTEVPLKMSESITTKGKQLKVGYRVHLETAADVIVNGVTVIPVGSPAMGEVTEVRNKGMWGKSGHISARVLYVTVNGRQIRLSGAFDDKGVTGTAGVVGAVALVPIAGFFMTGTSAHIDTGAPVKAFADEDVPFAASTVAATPVQVGPQAASASAPDAHTPVVQPAVATTPVSVQK